MRVAAVAGYAPRHYVTAETIGEALGTFGGAGIQRKAVPAPDEDALTMAYEAGRAALDAAGVAPGELAALHLGTTTPPVEEESVVARLASFFGADPATRQYTGSTRAGVEALVDGLERDGATLVVGSDAPRGAPDSDVEHAAGAGAGAVVLAADGAGEVLAVGEHTTPYPGTRFRRRGSAETEGLGITHYDRRAYREAVGGAVEGLPDDVDAAAVGGPDGSLPYRASDDLGVDSETVRAGATVHDLGDTGAAMPLLGLAKATREGAERTLVVGYGSGAAALALVVAGAPPVSLDVEPSEELTYADYLRARGEVTSGEPEGGGAYVSVPSWRRTLPQRHRLVAGRCSCGALALPPEGACPECGAFDAYERVELPGTGTVEALTTIRQGGAPPEFVEQQARSGAYVSAVVGFDGPEGGSVSVPAQVVAADDPAVGDRVAATIRRVYTQEGVTRYGVKVRPAGE